jgi:hypothetical protein
MTIRKATIAKISYRVNVGRSDAEIVPLGTLVRLKQEGTKTTCLVLLARTELKVSEQKKMDWVARQKLSNPMDFLRKEIDAAIAEKPVDLLSFLAAKFKWSVYVAPPANVTVPDELAQKFEECLSSLHNPYRKTGTNKTIREHSRVQRPQGAPETGCIATDELFASIAGPEFSDDDMEAYVPPAFMLKPTPGSAPLH